MIVNMLRAISRMLTGNDAATEIKCAKVMLDEIIKGLETKTATLEFDEVEVSPSPRPVKMVPRKEPPKPEELQVVIAVDTNRKLLPIKNLPMDAKIKLDGKTMTHKEAIGLTFTKIERVD